MLDGINIHPVGLCPKKLLANQLLNFKGHYSESTGEIYEYPLVAHYNNLKFTIHQGDYISISGSLHKYWQNGTNHQDFNLQDMQKAIVDLEYKFGLVSDTCKVKSFEFGINLRDIPISPQKILGLILLYKKRPFEFSNHVLRWKGQRFDIKLYDKGLQYGLDQWVFRFEIRVKKMIHVSEAEIYNLSDFTVSRNLEILGKKLVSTFNNFLIFDDRILERYEDLSSKDCAAVMNGWNQKFWTNMVQNESYATFKYRIKKLRGLLKRECGDTYQDQLSRMMGLKVQQLCHQQICSQINPLDIGLKTAHDSKDMAMIYPQIRAN